MNEVAFGMAVNETLWKRFQINYQNDVPQTNPLGRNNTVCNLLTATSWQHEDCMQKLFATEVAKGEGLLDSSVD